MSLPWLTNYLSELCQGRLALNKGQGINVFKVKQSKAKRCFRRPRCLSGDELSPGLIQQEALAGSLKSTLRIIFFFLKVKFLQCCPGWPRIQDSPFSASLVPRLQGPLPHKAPCAQSKFRFPQVLSQRMLQMPK